MTSQRARSLHLGASDCYLGFQEVLKFDPIDWSGWKTLYGFAYIGNHNWHYLTYGGGPEGGIVNKFGDGWCVWHRDWGARASYTRIPEELEIVYKNDDGHETIELVLYKHGCDDYELGEDEHFLDELESDMDWRHRTDDNESEEDASEEESDADMDSD